MTDTVDKAELRMTPGGSMEAIGYCSNWEHVPRAAFEEIKRLRKQIDVARKEARDQALEEAALIAETEGMHYTGLREGTILDGVTKSIRALKSS